MAPVETARAGRADCWRAGGVTGNVGSSPGERDQNMAYLDRDGVRIYYETHGTGPALLLTHGYSATSQMWRPQIEALAAEHTLILWDMRGHGRSGSPADDSLYSEALTVADMAALLDHLGVRDSHRRRAVPRRLHVARLLSGSSGAGESAADHRYRSGIQERCRQGSVEPDGPRPGRGHRTGRCGCAGRPVG